jgi:hypothetical protein
VRKDKEKVGENNIREKGEKRWRKEEKGEERKVQERPLRVRMV